MVRPAKGKVETTVDLHRRGSPLRYETFKCDGPGIRPDPPSKAPEVDIRPVSRSLPVELTIHKTQFKSPAFQPQGICPTRGTVHNQIGKLHPLRERSEVVIWPANM